MDVDGLLQSVIRFSNFMTSRLVVSGLVFYIFFGFTDIGSASEGFLPNADLLNEVVSNYQNIFEVLGVSDFALLLIFFLFLTTIHLLYVIFMRTGEFIPPAVTPLSGWEAIDDVTLTAFDILREARGEEHTDDENQRLYEFKKKLREIEKANEAAYHDEIAGVSAAYSIAKSMIVVTGLAALYALLFGGYSNDPTILAAILGALRVSGQDERGLHALARSKPAKFVVMVPFYGTLGELTRHMDIIRARRARRHAA